MENFPTESKRIVIAVTGASGIIYAQRLLSQLLNYDVEIYCIVSNAAKEILKAEIIGAPDIKQALRKIVENQNISKIDKIKFFDEDNFFAPCASGSFNFDAMAIVPCSMKTLGKIANSIADNLIVRAAEVALKERRRLVVVPRETPLALTQLRNMCALAEAGAIVMGASPAFYTNPQSIEDLADFIVARILSCMGFKQKILKEWGDEK